MTNSQKVGIWIVFAAVVFLLVAAYGLLPGLIVVCFVAAKMMLTIAMLYFVAWATNEGKPNVIKLTSSTPRDSKWWRELPDSPAARMDSASVALGTRRTEPSRSASRTPTTRAGDRDG
jgi:hypothetical protein